MTSWTERLDGMISGTFQRSPCGEALLLPFVCEYRSGYTRSIHHVDDRFLNVNGAVFGGYLAALFDHVVANTAMTILPDDHTLATAQLSINYFRPCLARTRAGHRCTLPLTDAWRRWAMRRGAALRRRLGCSAWTPTDERFSPPAPRRSPGAVARLARCRRRYRSQAASGCRPRR